MKIHFITFGCKVNQYETENMKQLFSQNGFDISENSSDSDVFVINSCTVTETGDNKIFKLIRRLRRENPDAVIALTGCFPQAFKDEAENIPELDIITGTKNRAELLNLIRNFLEQADSEKSKLVNVCSFTQDEKFEFMQNFAYTHNTRAFVKIQDGCNMFCSYCIIPYSRGRFRSKKLDDIICEVQNLASVEYKEIVLVGINLSFYGIEFGIRLVDAVKAVCSIDGIERVRLGSLEPEMITDNDINELSKLTKLCPQFHLSLQSGCDKTLKAMNRRYTSNDYELLVKKLRASFENCSITTDIMVGFPGETDEDFKESIAFVQKIGFSQSHIFPYSKRKGTPAALMDEQIPEHIKNIRAKKMSLETQKSAENFLQTQIGLTVPVLFEREKSDKIPHGYSPNYTLIKILTENSDKCLRNKIFYVKIVRLEDDYCIGEFVQKI